MGKNDNKDNNFYEIFITVIFGFVTYIALQRFSENLPKEPYWWFIMAVNVIVAIYFWLTCMATTSIETNLISDKKGPNIYQLIAILLSVALACPIVVMSWAYYKTNLSLFLIAYFTLYCINLGFDVFVLLIARHSDEGSIYWKWCVIDGIILLILLISMCFHTWASTNKWWSFIIFMIIPNILTFYDVVSCHKDQYRRILS